MTTSARSRRRRPLIQIFVDESFDARSLRDLQRQLRAKARELWADEMRYRAWRRAHPPGPVSPLDLDDPEVVKKWDAQLFAEVSRPTAFKVR